MYLICHFVILVLRFWRLLWWLDPLVLGFLCFIPVSMSLCSRRGWKFTFIISLSLFMDVFRGFFLSILPVVVCGGCGCGWFGIDGFGFDRFWSIGLWTPYSRPLSFRSVDGLGTYGVCMHACIYVCMYVVVLGITTYIYSMHTFGWFGCLGWRWCFMIRVCIHLGMVHWCTLSMPRGM